MKALLFISFAVVIVSGGVLFHIKHEVLQIDAQMRTVDRQLAETKEHLDLLKTEWSYLTNPERIQELTRRYLNGLRPLAQKQLMASPPTHKATSVFTQKPSPHPHAM